MPNRVPPKQLHIQQLTEALSDVDVIIGPTISDLAILKNDLVNLPEKASKLPKKFKLQYNGFRDFIYKALVKREIDKLIFGEEVVAREEENVIPISSNRQYLSAVLLLCPPKTLIPFSKRDFARYAPSCPVTPVTNAFFFISIWNSDMSIKLRIIFLTNLF